MSYCITPGCFNPQNPDNAKFCLSCGCHILLKNRYRPIQPLGHGGFGRTFLARDEESAAQTPCVIKQLYIQSQNSLILKKATQLFHQEAQRLNDLGKHPQIPSLIAHFEQQKQLYLVQEFIEGPTLEQELQQKGAFNEAQIRELLQDLMPVLKFIHDRQVLHRDIKPANIIRRSQDNKLFLIDFGVAKQITDSALFHTGTAVGTAEYIAPEQSRGKALPASDLYSLGVTCIHLLTGVSPFELLDISTNQWVWRDFLPRDRSLGDRLGRILDKLIQPAVSQRYQAAGDVLQALTQPAPQRRLPPPSPQPTPLLSRLWRQYTAKPQGDDLSSAVGIDYTKLQHLLAAGKWQQADAETWVVLCQAIGKPPNSYFQSSDLQKIPCDDLQTLDQLWMNYSQGRFGFSVQQQIYDDVERDYGQFCDRVGWPVHNHLRPYLKFSLSAPVGHLPSRLWASGTQLSRHAEALASKLENCQIR